MEGYAEYDGQIYRLEDHSFRWQKLGDACAQLGIELANAHDASADALATAQLIRHMADTTLPEKEVFQL
jgi:DNA polymerase III epsilon subunit-like protein